MEVLHIYAGMASDGESAVEALPVRKVDGGLYELLASPGLALNMARGDIIRWKSAQAPAEIVRRGGNICVHIYAAVLLPDSQRKQIEQAFLRALPAGAMDGQTYRNMVFTVPVQAGFPAIERFFAGVVEQYPHVGWFYANVYGEDGVTPLNWWLDR
jgi:hypothetical protein